MNIKAISRNVGYALLVSALFMLLAVFVSMINGNDSALAALLISFTITFIVGIFPFIFVRKTTAITLREGYVVIVLSWLLSFVFGMLPYALWGGPFTIDNAWFESVSGFTTSGATILSDIEKLPDSLLFWRSATHFIGGLGVVVFLLLIIPNSSPVRMRLLNMDLVEVSSGSFSIRANRTVYVFAYVYLAIALIAFISYMLAGMSPFDAICHAFSVCATGGFSTRNLSIGAFNSPLIELLTMIFMLASSVNFGMVFISVVNRSFKPLNNPVLKFYLSSVAVISIVVGICLKLEGMEQSLGHALWVGAFQTICISTTTGFAVADNSTWPLLPNFLILMMGVMCGCSGSTSGGVKADRVLVLIKYVRCQVGRILRPSAVNEVKLGTRMMKDSDVLNAIFYIAMYGIMLTVSTVLALILGLGGEDAISGSLASLGNLGPALGDLGTYGNYGYLSIGAKLLFTFDMFLGRVEIYPVLAVVGMALMWRRK